MRILAVQRYHLFQEELIQCVPFFVGREHLYGVLVTDHPREYTVTFAFNSHKKGSILVSFQPTFHVDLELIVEIPVQPCGQPFNGNTFLELTIQLFYQFALCCMIVFHHYENTPFNDVVFSLLEGYY